MKTRKKVYLPAWQKKFIPPLFLVLWAFITYEKFFGGNGEDLGHVEYAIMTLVFLGAGALIYAMASGRLSVYEIEEERDEGNM